MSEPILIQWTSRNDPHPRVLPSGVDVYVPVCSWLNGSSVAEVARDFALSTAEVEACLLFAWHNPSPGMPGSGIQPCYPAPRTRYIYEGKWWQDDPGSEAF